MTKILILGYGLSPLRREAIAIATQNLLKATKLLSHEIEVLSIDHLTNSNSLIINLLLAPIIIKKILDHIRNNQYTHVLDVFALPLSSVLFVVPILSFYPKLIYLKEFQNDHGYSAHFTFETLIRVLGNNTYLFNYILRKCSRGFSRNYNLSRKYNLTYLPTLISHTTRPRAINSNKVITISYLGHPLKKKGIDIFPSLVGYCNQANVPIKFAFAFSNLGDKRKIIDQIRGVDTHNICTFKGITDPYSFFSKADIYFLPIKDEFGAASTPNTVLEAMSAGAVVMTYQNPAIIGVVNSRNSILLETRDPEKITRLLLKFSKNRSELKKISDRALTHIKNHYGYNNYLKQLKEIYASKN